MNAGESEEQWIPIRYRDFWDVPHLFHLSWRGMDLLFDSAFDEPLNDYSPEYVVLSLPGPPPVEGSWLAYREAGVVVGHIPVDRVRFDETKRKFVDRTSIDSVLGML